ncbi:hypothetical protein OS21_36170 [Dickeya oryzae]
MFHRLKGGMGSIRQHLYPVSLWFGQQPDACRRLLATRQPFAIKRQAGTAGKKFMFDTQLK